MAEVRGGSSDINKRKVCMWKCRPDEEVLNRRSNQKVVRRATAPHFLLIWISFSKHGHEVGGDSTTTRYFENAPGRGNTIHLFTVKISEHLVFVPITVHQRLCLALIIQESKM